ncbi:HAD family hydrolase [Staphylococcus sp. 11261D007BR]
MYRAAIFDFDGTIIDTEQHLFETINQHLTEDGHEPITIEFYRSNIGGRALPLHRYLVDLLGEDHVSRIYEAHHQSAAHLPLRPGVLELLETLHARHIPIAVASSSSREQVQKHIESLGIGSYISVVKGREDVEAVKPAPDLYLTAVQALNYSPAHCLAIEDSVRGATAAVTAGLDVIVNTNAMTQVNDFSHLPIKAKDIDLSTVVSRYFNGM